jgi:isopropylmalate/homocitrate/citramalate synthase
MTASMDERTWEVLTQANEDYSGLYEIAWAFRSRFLPNADEAALIAAATDAVRALLDRGYIRLVRFRQKPEEVAEVPPDEVASVLASPDSWRPPRSWEEAYPSVDATETGERAWRRPQ